MGMTHQYLMARTSSSQSHHGHQEWHPRIVYDPSTRTKSVARQHFLKEPLGKDYKQLAKGQACSPFVIVYHYVRYRWRSEPSKPSNAYSLALAIALLVLTHLSSTWDDDDATPPITCPLPLPPPHLPRNNEITPSPLPPPLVLTMTPTTRRR